MKMMSMYSIRPGSTKEAVSRFLAGKGQPPTGVKLVGRWHKADSSGGDSLYESDDPAALFEHASASSDLLEIHRSVVLDDAEAGPVLAKVFK